MTVRSNVILLGMALGATLLALLTGAYGLWFARKPLLRGVNLPSATFAARKLPGQSPTDYFYPDEADIDYFVENGMNVIRLGFLWERLQPELNRSFDQDEQQLLDRAVRIIVGRNATVILDLHNYARYRGRVLGSAGVPEESFADFWGRLATIYKNDEHVVFGLMNEPHDIRADQWLRSAQAAINRIRQAGARNLILVSSAQWDAASRFTADGDLWKRIIDPDDNFVFEVHQYLDRSNTGTHLECPDAMVGVAAVRSVTRWMQQNKRRVFLGEFGASGRTDCLAALANMLDFVDQRADVWMGWTYFAGGRGWRDDDILSIQPTSNGDKLQMKLLKEYLH